MQIHSPRSPFVSLSSGHSYFADLERATILAGGSCEEVQSKVMDLEKQAAQVGTIRKLASLSSSVKCRADRAVVAAVRTDWWGGGGGGGRARPKARRGTLHREEEFSFVRSCILW
jgi:hypothetical protein